MSRQLSNKIFMALRKYPFLYDQRHPEHTNARKCEGAWEQIAKHLYKNQWADLTLQQKAKKGKKYV